MEPVTKRTGGEKVDGIISLGASGSMKEGVQRRSGKKATWYPCGVSEGVNRSKRGPRIFR